MAEHTLSQSAEKETRQAVTGPGHQGERQGAASELLEATQHLRDIQVFYYNKDIKFYRDARDRA